VLPRWLATTTSLECAKALRPARRPHAAGQTLQTRNIPDASAATAEQELEQELLLAERHAALREAFADLPPDRQRLLALLIKDLGAIRQNQR
jgi:DNA-directed RNA polymerase specialized sigma24 family protein